jgi:hypothetical protein
MNASLSAAFKKGFSMFQIMTLLLLCDTLLFVVLGNFLARGHFFLKMPRLALVLFPWFALLVWLARPAKKFYQNNRQRYYACQMLLSGIGFALMVLGACLPNNGVSPLGLLLCLWTWIGDVLVHRHDDDRGDGKREDPDEPDSPTPTGDTADTWLKELSQLPTYR